MKELYEDVVKWITEEIKKDSQKMTPAALARIGPLERHIEYSVSEMKVEVDYWSTALKVWSWRFEPLLNMKGNKEDFDEYCSEALGLMAPYVGKMCARWRREN